MCRATLCVAALLLCAARASAFTFESSISHGCHERITIEAQSVVGWPGARTPPALDGALARAVSDVPFVVPPGADDPWSIALLIGVRENDLHGVSPFDLTAFALVHADPAGQDQHCLRAPSDDGPDGDRSALAACRAFIAGQLALAVGDGDTPSPEPLEPVDVVLTFRGATRIELSSYAFRLGRALHALQDSFTHTFRSEDLSRVRHVVNYSDWARSDDDFVPERDGHKHLGNLDLCQGTPDAERRARAAATASARLTAALQTPGPRAVRLAAALQVVDETLAYESGCVAGNDWCEAREPGLPAGCQVAGLAAPHGLLWCLPVLLLVARRRTLLLLLMLYAAPVQAGGRLPPRPFSLQLGLGAAIDHGGLVGAIGGRLDLHQRFALGLDVEYNPWFSIDTGQFSEGVVDVYASGVISWLRLPRIELRSSLHLGLSVLLFNMVGIDAGSVGPYAAINIVSLAIPVSRTVAVTIQPAEISMPIPSVRGVPFFYRQYRIMVGIQWRP